MNTNRRHFLRAAGLAVGATGLAARRLLAAEGAPPPSFLKAPSKMRLGTVTYNLAQDWDLDTLIKNCQEARFAGVELRTSHAHKVEVALTAL